MQRPSTQTKKLILVLLIAAFIVGGLFLFMSLPTKKAGSPILGVPSEERHDSGAQPDTDPSNKSDDKTSNGITPPSDEEAEHNMTLPPGMPEPDQEDLDRLRQLDDMADELRQMPLHNPTLDPSDNSPMQPREEE